MANVESLAVAVLVVLIIKRIVLFAWFLLQAFTAYCCQQHLADRAVEHTADPVPDNQEIPARHLPYPLPQREPPEFEGLVPGQAVRMFGQAHREGRLHQLHLPVATGEEQQETDQERGREDDEGVRRERRDIDHDDDNGGRGDRSDNDNDNEED